MPRALHRLSQAYGLTRMLGPRQLAMFLYERIRGGSLVKLRVRGIQGPLFCRPRERDLRVLWQIFGRSDCAVNLDRAPRLIIDGGAHVGYASVYFANRFPTARVLAVEPDSANCALFQINTQNYPGIELVEGALWSHEAELRIVNPQSSGWAFRVAETEPGSPASLRGTTIGELMKRAGVDTVDILKIDIEGAEEVLFGQAGDWIQSVRVIVLEVHSERAWGTVLRAVQGHDFRISRQAEKLILTRALCTLPFMVG